MIIIEEAGYVVGEPPRNERERELFDDGMRHALMRVLSMADAPGRKVTRTTLVGYFRRQKEHLEDMHRGIRRGV